MSFQFRGCLLGLNNLTQIEGIPIYCSSSCIITNINKSTSSLQIIGSLPFLINQNATNLNELLSDLTKMNDINISSLSISCNCMMIAISSNNKHYIILIGNNEYSNLGISKKYKSYIHNPIVIPLSSFFKNNSNNNLLINKVICCEKYSLILDNNGIVYECGDIDLNSNDNNDNDIDIKMNENDNNINNRKYIIKQINASYFNNEKIIDISCGLIHNIALSSALNVYCWGSNIYNACGDAHSDNNANNINYKYPNLISHFLSPIISVKSIDCGLWHSCVLTENGCIYTWGLNKDGQLGIGKHLKYSKQPQLVRFNNNNDIECVSMSSGNRHICVIDSNKYLWAWGYNKFNQVIKSTKHIIWKPFKIQTIQNVEFVKCSDWYSIVG